VLAYVGISNTWYAIIAAPADITVPHLYRMTYDGDTLRLYIDGVQVASNGTMSGAITYAGAQRDEHIGSDDQVDFPGTRRLDGKIDEVRFQTIAGSADYAKAEYEIIANHSTYTTYNASSSVGYNPVSDPTEWAHNTTKAINPEFAGSGVTTIKLPKLASNKAIAAIIHCWVNKPKRAVGKKIQPKTL